MAAPWGVTQLVRPVGNTQSSVQVLVNDDVATRQRPSPVHLLDLQGQVLEAHGVVPIHDSGDTIIVIFFA